MLWLLLLLLTLLQQQQQHSSLLTPALEIRSGLSFFDTEPANDPPRRLSDLAWPQLTVSDRGGASELIDALSASPQPLAVMEIASARLRATIGLSIDMAIVDDDYDGNVRCWTCGSLLLVSLREGRLRSMAKAVEAGAVACSEE